LTPQRANLTPYGAKEAVTVNFITINKSGDPQSGVMFRVADDPWVSRQLWLFFVENLQPGFTVTIAAGERELSQASGYKLAASEYAYIMDTAKKGGEA